MYISAPNIQNKPNSFEKFVAQHKRSILFKLYPKDVERELKKWYYKFVQCVHFHSSMKIVDTADFSEGENVRREKMSETDKK